MPPKRAAPQDTPKNARPRPADPPVVKAARARLYTIVSRDGDDLRVLNKEGLTFGLNVSQVTFIGEFSETKKVGRTAAMRALEDYRGSFIYIQFTKEDGSDRVMYAELRGIEPTLIHLNDIDFGEKSPRSARTERIQEMIFGGVRYIIKD